MAKVKCFMDRMMAGISRELIYDSATFIRTLANRLDSDCLSTRIWHWEITEHFGKDISFLRAAIAMDQMTRCQFTFEKNGRYQECALIVFVDYDLDREIMQIYFTQEGRDLLQDWSWEWTLQMVPGNV